MPSSRRRFVARRALLLTITVASVGLLTYLDRNVFAVNSATAAFSYLLLLLGIASRAGLEASISASLLSVLCYNYFFLAPIGTLTIVDPQNWIALLTFLVTAATVSHLSAVARKQANEAMAGRREMTRLYEFSRALMLGDSRRQLAGQIAQKIAEVFSIPAVSLYEAAPDTVTHAGPREPLLGSIGPEKAGGTMRDVTRTGRRWERPDVPAVIVPFSLGGHVLGSLSMAGASVSEPVLSAICQLTAIELERSRVQDLMNRAKSARQNEELKSTLLDALAHEFKTPLTSIKGAVSSVISQRAHDCMEGELLTIIDEETDRLTSLVTESIQIARIGAGPVELHREAYPVSTLIGSALAKLRNLADERHIEVLVPPDLPPVEIDPELSELALRQLIGNAIKYAPADARIRVASERRGRFIALHVSNEGPGIPEAEQPAVFEKFYRGKDVRRHVPGTGMGLTIAREIVRAHDGEIWLESKPGEGACFSLTLPVVS